MIPLKRKLLLKFYKLFDLILMGIAFGMAARLTFIQSAEAASFADFLSLRVKIQNFVIFLGILIVWH